VRTRGSRGGAARGAGARTAFSEEAVAYHAVFPRRAREFVAERTRLRYFPALAARIPELREEFFYRRWFLTRRSAAFDLAVLGGGWALARRSPTGLVAAWPYARMLRDELKGKGVRIAATVGLARVAADAVGLASLARGSIERRALVL
jgi:hypothetical protein